MERAAFNLTGTSEMIGRSGGAPTDGLLFIPASVIGGSPILYGPTQSGGDSLVWFAGFSASTFRKWHTSELVVTNDTVELEQEIFVKLVEKTASWSEDSTTRS